MRCTFLSEVEKCHPVDPCFSCFPRWPQVSLYKPSFVLEPSQTSRPHLVCSPGRPLQEGIVHPQSRWLLTFGHFIKAKQIFHLGSYLQYGQLLRCCLVCCFIHYSIAVKKHRWENYNSLTWCTLYYADQEPTGPRYVWPSYSDATVASGTVRQVSAATKAWRFTLCSYYAFFCPLGLPTAFNSCFTDNICTHCFLHKLIATAVLGRKERKRWS